SAVLLWDLATKKPATLYETGTSSEPLAVALSPDGELLAGAWIDGKVRVIERATGAVRFSLDDTKPQALAFSPDSKRLAVGGKELRLFDSTMGDLAQSLPE